MTADELLARFSGVRRSGKGWAARCPAHNDHKNSGLITPGARRWFITCFAGCRESDILAALSLTAEDLWYERRNGHGSGGPSHPTGRKAPIDALAWLADYCQVPAATIAALPVTDAPGGRLMFEFGPDLPHKLRTPPGKDFSWEPAGAPVPPLWPLPTGGEALPARVWFTEGETDAIVARHLGLDAFALTRGAGTALTAAQAAALRARGVTEAIVAFDADQAGRDGAARLAAVLHGAGIAVIEIDLAGAGLVDPLTGGKDLRDLWRAAAARGETAEAVRQRLEAAARAAVASTPADELAAPAGAGAPPRVREWPALAPEALHGPAGDVVRAIAPHTEADPVALLLSFLSAFGVLAGNGPHGAVGAERHELRLWPVLVGATAKGRKGSSWAPIKDLLGRVDAAWAAANVTSGLSSGEGLIWQVRDPITRREKHPQTGEYEDRVVDAGVDDKRLLVLETEFSAPLKLLTREGNILSTVLRQAWDTGELRTLVKNSPARATGAHIGVLGHAVAEEVRRYLVESEAAGGFANRFLWACVRRSQVLPEGGSPSEHEFADVAESVRQAYRFARCHSGRRGPIVRDEAARRLWAGVYPTLSSGRPGLAGAITARAEAQVLRLSALYALLDRSPVVQVPHLLAALAVWDYCDASATWIFGDRLGDPIADAVLEALRERGELSRWDITNLLGRNVSAGRILTALRRLLEMGLVAVEKRDTGGRPAEVWRLAG